MRSRWKIECAKRERFSGARSSDSNKTNREESPEKPESNGKRRMRGRCGRKRKGCRLTRFALSRRWRFYSREFTAVRSQPFLRSEVISEFSPDRPVYFLYFLLPREMLRGAADVNRVKENKELVPFVITSCIAHVTRSLHRKQTEAKFIYYDSRGVFKNHL